MSSQLIFDFSPNTNISDWIIVNDDVMGGRSTSKFLLDSEGHGAFSGAVSLENNGGFASVRYEFKKIAVKKYDKIVLKLRGDGKNYQIRIKANKDDYYSYIAPFSTSGEWETIEIDLKNMYPSFRGRKLSMANFDAPFLEEICFLIGNKQKESFNLFLDRIELK